jgi:hypothetical protein
MVGTSRRAVRTPQCGVPTTARSDSSSANDGVRASMRGGRSIGGGHRIAVRKNQSPARRRSQTAVDESTEQDAAAAAARNCKLAQARGTVQSFQCRHSSAEQIRTRMRTWPML